MSEKKEKKHWKVTINFTADSDWRPMLESACWFDCPFTCFTKLGHQCHCKEVYDKYGDVLCPVYRYGSYTDEALYEGEDTCSK